MSASTPPPSRGSKTREFFCRSSSRLQGTVTALPEQARKPREFEVDDRSALNPAPGLDGVLR